MSLTSFIKIPEVKELFKKTFPLSKTILQGEIKAVPVTKNYPLVGTAFDYLFRFYLERENLNCVTKPWIADNSVELLDQNIESYEKKSPKEMLEASVKMKSFLYDAKKVHKEYLKTGNLGKDLIRSSVILAQMDAYYRSGLLFPSLGKVDNGDVQDLSNLIALVKPETFKAKKACFLNPHFGRGSQLVNGADADLIVDDMLVDLKTTKFLTFTQDQYNQIIGYYVLSKLGKVNESEDIKISKIGIYFSRHGILHTISVKEIENNPNFSKFVRVFEKLATVVFRESK
jgi:hypothetical protein